MTPQEKQLAERTVRNCLPNMNYFIIMPVSKTQHKVIYGYLTLEIAQKELAKREKPEYFIVDREFNRK